MLASPSTALAATSPVQHGSVGPAGFAVAVQPLGLIELATDLIIRGSTGPARPA